MNLLSGVGSMAGGHAAEFTVGGAELAKEYQLAVHNKKAPSNVMMSKDRIEPNRSIMMKLRRMSLDLIIPFYIY
jgi:hypothetical protein